MIAVLVALFTVGLGVVIGLQGAVINRLGRVEEELRTRDIDHAMCIAHVSHYVGNHFAAKVLKAAADDYASAEGQHGVKVIINASSHQTLSENPIPSLWLHKRADRLVAEVEVDS